MIKRFDHLTIVVRDLADARRFFGLLGFEEAVSVVISGEVMARYMGVAGIEADHVTLVAKGVVPRTEIGAFCITGIRTRSLIRIFAICTNSVSTTSALPSMISMRRFPQ